MSIKVVNVYLHTQSQKLKVGRLALKERQIYFEYDGNFLKTGIELSPYKLPLSTGVKVCDERIFDGLFGVFADSLPDGWGKLLIDRQLMSQGVNFAQISSLDRLMMIGEFGTGALSYEPLIQSVNAKKMINLDELAISSQEILKGVSAKNIETLIANNGSSAGARPKIMVQLNKDAHLLPSNQPLVDGFEHYMVKFAGSTDSPHIGKLEYIYSLMAKDAGVDISETKLLQGKENSYFAIKRFDRNGDKRVHIHSLAGLVHSDFRLPSIDYDDILKLTLHLTKDMSEVLKVYRLAVFNLLTHNRDDHAKNFSYLLNENNNWRFAPAYDLTFSFGPGGEHSTTYLGEGRELAKKHLEELAKKHGIKEYKSIIDKIYSVVSNFKKYASDVQLPQKYTDEIYGQFVEV
ncbi:type II toxin-antitoxin system HipA family toxin [Sulfurimonas sp.]|uniref:type II toxin-antitoxin system HipA family toxin n=1 Tax=Sulfurimonas sp. TaxID=2022749 RepID=UPI0025D9693C|nr:type II toxin-antitoxin system HipA family toxin [Sulfurimonas sp.]MBW6489105.1 type II toxin-antitoxin system HipA family toxin [Sulfurimonas sp.]